MKHQFSVFYEIEKGALEMFVQRLSFQLYKPEEIVAKQGQSCTDMIMFIDGQVDALQVLPKSSYLDKLTSESENHSSFKGHKEGFIQTFKTGDSFGE